MSSWRLRGRLALGFAATTVAIVSLATVALSARSDDVRRAEAIERAQSEAADLAGEAAHLLDRPVALSALGAAAGDDEVAVVDADHTVLSGQVTATSDQIDDAIDAALEADDRGVGGAEIVEGDSAVGASVVRRGDEVDAFVIVRAAIPPRHGWRQLYGLDAPLGATLALLAGISGWVLAGRVARPLDAVTDEVTALALGAAERPPHRPSRIPEVAALHAATTRLAGRLHAEAADRTTMEQNLRRLGHELRTPITTARLRLEQLAEESSASGAGEDPMAIAAVIDAQLERIGVVAEQIVRLRTAGTARDDVDLAEVTRSSVAHLVPMANWNRITLRLSAPSPVPLRGEPAALADAVTNVVENAVKYTPRGGRVELTVGTEEQYAVLAVADSGPGFPPAMTTLVRAAAVRVVPEGHATGGTGQGLAIVAATLDRHGGHLEIGAAPGGGALVRLLLPLGVTSPPGASQGQ